MSSLHVGTTVRTFVAIVLFALGVAAGSAFGIAGAAPTSNTACDTGARAQTAPTAWSEPPTNDTGRPGQAY